MSHEFSVSLSEEHHLDANRLHYWNSVLGKGSIKALLWLAFLYFCVGIITAFVHDGSFAQTDWMEVATIGFVAGLAVLVFCYAFGFATLSRRSRRLFAQQKLLHYPITYLADDDAIKGKSDLTDMTLPYNLAYGWVENSKVFLIYHTDSSFQILPKIDVPVQSIDFLRQKLKNHDISGRSL